MEEQGQQVDWRTMKEVVLRRKVQELQQFCQENGIVIKARILVSDNGDVAQAVPYIDLV